MRIISLLLILIFSCTTKTENTSFIKPDKMEAVIWDLMRVDELINEQYRKDSTINKFEESVGLYKQVFQIHNISEEQFKNSFNNYRSKPNSLKPILDSLQTRGNNINPVFKPALIE